MTVISDTIENVAGVDPTTAFVFSVPVIRETFGGTGLVTTQTVRITAAANGTLTTPDLDPGPASVAIGGRDYPIDIPNSGTPVRLWPLISAGLPVPPSEEATAVRNGGGVARAQRVTQAVYNSLTTPDPETLYVITA